MLNRAASACSIRARGHFYIKHSNQGVAHHDRRHQCGAACEQAGMRCRSGFVLAGIEAGACATSWASAYSWPYLAAEIKTMTVAVAVGASVENAVSSASRFLQPRKGLSKLGHLGRGHCQAVALRWMTGKVVLVVVLGGPIIVQRQHFGHDLAAARGAGG